MYNKFERRKQRKKLHSKIESATTSNQHVHSNSDKKRTVEKIDSDLILKEVIVTCYFTLKPDPQTGFFRNAADFKYIQPWYDSLLKIGTSGIILHDGLEQEFIKHYQNKQIQFRYCEMGNYSIFEERWILYYILLEQLPNLEKAFFTDSNDVYITKNPFYIVNNDKALYVGRDNANRIKDSGWLKEECDKFIEESNHPLLNTYTYQWAYNAGIVGGTRLLLLFLTFEMSNFIFKSDSTYHKDMTLLNIVIHENFYPKLSSLNWSQKIVDTNNDSYALHQNLITGFPFNSGFKMLELNSKALFIHK
jgi:hypothetical protein